MPPRSGAFDSHAAPSKAQWHSLRMLIAGNEKTPAFVRLLLVYLQYVRNSLQRKPAGVLKKRLRNFRFVVTPSIASQGLSLCDILAALYTRQTVYDDRDDHDETKPLHPFRLVILRVVHANLAGPGGPLGHGFYVLVTSVQAPCRVALLATAPGIHSAAQPGKKRNSPKNNHSELFKNIQKTSSKHKDSRIHKISPISSIGYRSARCARSKIHMPAPPCPEPPSGVQPDLHPGADGH